MAEGTASAYLPCRLGTSSFHVLRLGCLLPLGLQLVLVTTFHKEVGLTFLGTETFWNLGPSRLGPQALLRSVGFPLFGVRWVFAALSQPCAHVYRAAAGSRIYRQVPAVLDLAVFAQQRNQGFIHAFTDSPIHCLKPERAADTVLAFRLRYQLSCAARIMPPFPRWEKAQRRAVTCPRSHSLAQRKVGMEASCRSSWKRLASWPLLSSGSGSCWR